MEFLAQTRDAIKELPFFFKTILLIWSFVALCFIFPNIRKFDSLNIVDALFMFGFTLCWTMGTLSITLIYAFRRRNKKQLNSYAKEPSNKKISNQTYALALQSKKAYEQMITSLPPELANDQGLYVGTKWGRISKAILIITVVYNFLASIL